MNTLILAAVLAESVLVPRPVPVPEPPQPVFRPAVIRSEETPVAVRSESKVAADNGLYRRVETTITFTNPNSRVFEGELEFPLPEKATVCGYSLEINGELVPGVVVGKEEARVAFENEKRKGVDPGVVEHVKGNVWKTRIYPLNPRTPRRCRVSYIEEIGASALPKDAGIVVERAGNEIFVGRRLGDGGVKVEPLAERLRRASRAIIFWDASMSRRDGFAEDRNLLECLPEKGDFELVVFRNVIDAPRKFAVRAELLRAIDALAYDGGTCIEKVLARKSAAGDQSAAFVFSDEYREPKPRSVEVRKLAAGEKPPAEPKEGDLLAIAWAANRVEDLAEDAASHRAELVEIGRRYGVASPVTSLIVLETLKQYQDYKIEPPKCMDFYGQWKKWREAEDDLIGAEKLRAEHRSRLLHYWEERVRWWNDPIPPKPETPKSGVFSRMRNAAAGMFGGARSEERMAVAEESMPAAAPAALSADDEPAVERRSMSARRSAAEPIVKQKAKAAGGGTSAAIKIAAWDPKMPYLEAMTGSADPYAEYLRQRDLFGTSPAFYLDCAGWFFRKGDKYLGARIISNLSEMKLEEVGLWRTMGWRLREAGLYDEAVEVFRHVLDMRGEEPQSKRDLALVLTEKAKNASRGASSPCRDSLAEAARLLHEAAFKPTARRSGRRGNDMQTSVMALEELNGLLTWVRANGIEVKLPELDEAFRREMPLALRIMLSWDTDETDVDLHVLEPDGEEAYYGHRRTASGGFVSEDVTTGYGPEEYLRKEASKGVYRIAANFYASHRQALTGAATITATVYTDWATDREKREIMSFRLDKPKDKHPIGEVKIGE